VKRIAISAAIAVAILVVSWGAVEYASGYSGFPIVTPFMFMPLSFLLFALTFLASCLAIIFAMVAVIRGRLGAVGVGVIVVVLFLSWASSPWFLARSAFLRGFAAHLRHTATPAEIELASQTCLSLLPNGGRVYGPNKIMGPTPEEEEQSKRAWDALRTYRFVHFKDDTCVIFVEPPEVAFTWGGALPGHWGVHVRASDSSELPADYLQTLRFSDRILLFRGH
jgi:hypothetical protein